MEFHGVFLNTATRSQYVNLNTQQLFYTVTERSFQTTGQGTQQQTLDFKNAVFEIIVAVRNGIDTGNNMRNPWRFEGTAADSITGERDDALRSLEFSLSSTPRTLTNLEAQYYRLVYPFMFAETMSDLKGLYYYPLKTREYLNGTRIVNGYINASKIDDLRVRYNVNDAAYSSSLGLIRDQILRKGLECSSYPSRTPWLENFSGKHTPRNSASSGSINKPTTFSRLYFLILEYTGNRRSRRFCVD